MSQGLKTMFKVVGVLSVLGAVLVFSAGAAVYNAGVVHVDVLDKSDGGVRVVMPVPAVLLTAGLAFAPDEAFAEARRHIGPWSPAVRAALEALEECEDGILVDVTTSDETVLIEKQGRALLIGVDTDDAQISLSVPIRSLRSLVNRLDDAPGLST